jgi:hypothetical protein
MRRLTCSRKTSIVIHNEDYLNSGLKQDDMIKAIENIDGVWMVEKYPINNNIQVHIHRHNKEYINRIMYEIQCKFENMLNEYYDEIVEENIPYNF